MEQVIKSFLLMVVNQLFMAGVGSIRQDLVRRFSQRYWLPLMEIQDDNGSGF